MMKQRRMIRNRLLTSVLVIAVFTAEVSVDGMNVMAASEELSKTQVKEKVYSMVKKYDPDVYYILKKEESDTDFMDYYDAYGGIESCFDTAVHETYHGFVFHFSNLYAGGNTGYSLNFYKDDYFKTEEMAKKIPQRLRTFRYDTYVAEGSVVTSNKNGVYGLLNEFAAYYWGCRANSSLMGYYRENAEDSEVWADYAVNIGNDMTAYAEFKYWILGYMLYAQQYHPDVYKALLGDTVFCSAYAAIETQFRALLEENKNGVASLNEFLQAYGQRITWNETKVEGGGYYAELADYALLAREMNTSAYIYMDRILKNHASDDTATISINYTETAVAEGEHVVLKLNNTQGRITWKSSDVNVATVNSRGEVTGKKDGCCTISGTVENRTFYCSVIVD